MNSRIAKNLAKSGFETRPTEGNGIWCSLLLPLIFILNTVTFNVSPLYKVTSFLSLGLLLYSIIFILFINNSCATLKETTFKGATPLSFICAVLMNFFTHEGLTFCILISITSLHLYSNLLRYLLKELPKTFTVGEAIVVSQGVILFVSSFSISKIIGSNQIDEEERFFHDIILTVLTTVILVITVLNYLNENSKNVTNLVRIISVAAILEIILLLVFLGPTVVPKLFNYLISSYRVKILSVWLSLVIIAVIVLIIQTQLSIKADTSTRKCFHILASAVFLTGLLGDFKLMVFASGIGLALLILVEALRKSKIEPISTPLQSAFVTYSDEKDCGVFAMTPLYLFCGLACPIVLVPSQVFSLELLSGVLSIGVGDTAASFFGSRYGRIKWPGTNKTVEGMVCNALFQVILVILLDYFAFLPPAANISRTAIAASICALVEINTDQVDNLILPLVMLATYRATLFII